MTNKTNSAYYFERLLACLNKGLTTKNTAFVAKVNEQLVYEYVNLIAENQNEITSRETACQSCDFDDILSKHPGQKCRPDTHPYFS